MTRVCAAISRDCPVWVSKLDRKAGLLDKTAEMRSDQYWWKKLGERDDLDLFLSAYAEATGESLTVAEEGETPDFVCERENGLRVGVELTKIIAHPETRRWHRLF